MDYGQILRRCFEIVKNYRYLWAIGLLALFTEGGGGAGLNTPIQLLSSLSTNSPSDATKNARPMMNADSAIHWADAHWGTLVAAFVLVVCLCLALAYFSYCAKAGLILSVNDYEENGHVPPKFVKSVATGKPFAWRLFGMNIVVHLLALACIGILAAPLIVSWMKVIGSQAQPWALALVVIASILLVCIAVVILVFTQILLKISERLVVLKNRRIVASLREGFTLIRVQMGRVLLTWLVGLGASALWGLALFAAIMALAVVLIIIGALLYSVVKTPGTVAYAIIVGIASFAALMAFNGAYVSFLSAYWTVCYRALSYLAQTSE